MKQLSMVTALLALLLTSACSSLKSTSKHGLGVESEEIEACKAYSLDMVKPNMRVITPALTMPDRTVCTTGTSQGSTYCTQIPGIRYPAVEEDINTDARIQVLAECLLAKQETARIARLAALGESIKADKSQSTPQAVTARFAEAEALARQVLTAKSDAPAHLRAKSMPARKDCDYCPALMLIPAGSFKMGSNSHPAEQPVRAVSVPSFLLGKYEVTQGEWKAVMGSNPSANTACGDHCPVERISWYEAKTFVQRLNEKTGLHYRLPSEAEWEYAAQLGSNGPSTPEAALERLHRSAWFSSNSQGQVHPVGLKAPNRFGLHDMQGNVWEWVEDAFHESYQGAGNDGRARPGGSEPSKRVLRGGSWFNEQKLLRPQHRNAEVPEASYVFFGLRLARDLSAGELAQTAEPKAVAGESGAAPGASGLAP
ncbi:hypothetical protein C1O66_19415 [Paucibacter aquatile]|uniref:Sulfatase-modifying factor enzyme-like domain-containing protein n=1 Tax=Kinneretia aquatilis TaxID=2070761 RepID=A0A2N8L193_9BURK|nr:formylglycine-generating enzyme family protein [Paucibacter aquatile]PND39489.1 hypothetical protein C1O66_19415 [Paucibacter aquatile]